MTSGSIGDATSKTGWPCSLSLRYEIGKAEMTGDNPWRGGDHFGERSIGFQGECYDHLLLGLSYRDSFGDVAAMGANRQLGTISAGLRFPFIKDLLGLFDIERGWFNWFALRGLVEASAGGSSLNAGGGYIPIGGRDATLGYVAAVEFRPTWLMSSANIGVGILGGFRAEYSSQRDYSLSSSFIGFEILFGGSTPHKPIKPASPTPVQCPPKEEAPEPDVQIKTITKVKESFINKIVPFANDNPNLNLIEQKWSELRGWALMVHPQLDLIIKYLRQNPNVSIGIDSFANDTHNFKTKDEGYKYNLKLAQQRLGALCQYMTGHLECRPEVKSPMEPVVGCVRRFDMRLWNPESPKIDTRCYGERTPMENQMWGTYISSAENTDISESFLHRINKSSICYAKAHPVEDLQSIIDSKLMEDVAFPEDMSPTSVVSSIFRSAKITFYKDGCPK